MKKLIIAASLMCVAAMSYGAAASWQWQSNTTSTKGVMYDGTSAKAYATYGAADLYLFDVATYSQETAFSALTGSGLATAKAVASTQLNDSSKISAKAFEYGLADATKTYSFYTVAVFDDDHFYISDTLAYAALETGTKTLAYTFNVTSKTLKDASAGWNGASVYSVPEPTSGLLLLLGMAGLALRRRRA